MCRTVAAYFKQHSPILLHRNVRFQGCQPLWFLPLKRLVSILLLTACFNQSLLASEVTESVTKTDPESIAIEPLQLSTNSIADDLQAPATPATEESTTDPLSENTGAVPALAKSELKLKDSQPAENIRYPTKSSYFEMAGGLFVVLAIFIGMAWAMRRFNLQMPGAQSNIKMLSALAVGPKEKVLLLEVEGEKLLIGVTAHAINPLHQFKQPTNLTQDKSDDFAKQMESLLKQGTVHE